MHLLGSSTGSKYRGNAAIHTSPPLKKKKKKKKTARIILNDYADILKSIVIATKITYVSKVFVPAHRAPSHLVEGSGGGNPVNRV